MQTNKIPLPSTSAFKKLGLVLSRKEKFVLYFSIFILIASLITWGVNFYLTSTEKSPGVGGEYTEGIVGQPVFVNPILSPAFFSQSNETDALLCELIFSSLMKYNEEGKLEGDLAEYYNISEDGKKYEFQIRQGVKWHDKTDLTAQDIEFTIKLIQDSGYRSPLDDDFKNVKVSTQGNHKVVFELNEPYSPFINLLTVGILPKHIFEQISKSNFLVSEFNLKPVGSGPFEFSNIEQDSEDNIISYQLLRNPEYYGDKAYLEKITFNFYDEKEGLLEAYRKREVNGFGISDFEKVEEFTARKDTSIHNIKVPRYYAVFFNQTKSVPLADQKVRQALRLATDRNSIIQEIFHGYADEVFSPILPQFGEFSSAVNPETLAPNLEEAEKLLDEAGWKKADDGPRKKGEEVLEISLITTSWRDLSRSAEILKGQWEQLGVRVNVTSLEFTDFNDNFIRPREYQAVLFAQEYFGNEPDLMHFWHSSGKKDPGKNIAVYSHDDIDNALTEARKTNDLGQRAEHYKKFEERIAQDAPATFLFSPNYIYVVNRKVKGVTTSAMVNPAYRLSSANKWFVKTVRTKK